MPGFRRFLHPRLLLIALLGLFTVGISGVLAVQYLHPDGRINQIAHFGGDALYCLDDDGNVVNNALGTPGFRLLSIDGQILWEVSPAEVAAANEALMTSEGPVLAASGQGSYGPVALYVVSGGSAFVFTGYDEHGKANSLAFTGCAPVGGGIDAPDEAAPPADGDEEPSCTVTTNQHVTSTYALTTFVPDGTRYYAIASTDSAFATDPTGYYLFYHTTYNTWIQWDGPANGGAIVGGTCLPLPAP